MPTDPMGVMGLPTGTSSLTSTSGTLTGPQRERARIKKASQEFESVFVGMMLKQMRKSMTGSNPLFGGSSQAKMYQDMMDDMTAQQMSKTSPFGLAKTLERSMESRLHISEKASPGTTAQVESQSHQSVEGITPLPVTSGVPEPQPGVQKTSPQKKQ